MTKTLFILVLNMMSMLVLSQDTLTTFSMEDVVIKDNRLSIPFREKSRSITVITQDDIRAYPARSVGEVLKHFAGIDVRQRGVHGLQSDISLRGSTFDQVLVLVDGIALSDPQTGHHSMNLPISVHAIRRIEIIKGPAARIYGQNAFAGAVNIVTKRPKDELTAGIDIGDFGLVSGHLSGSLTKTKTLLALQYQESAGYRYNTDYQLVNGFLRQDWSTGSIQWKLLGGMTSRKFGANGFYASPTYQDQYEETQTSLIALESSSQLNAQLWFSARASWRRNQDMYLFVRDKPEIYRNMHIGNNLLTELNSRYTHKIGTLGFGIQYGSYQLNSNNLGGRSRQVVGLFAEERIQLLDDLSDRSIEITPGISYHQYSDFGAVFYPGVDFGYRWNQYWRWHGNVGYTWRIPTFTDLYYVGPTNEGNDELIPESAFTYETGIRYSNRNFELAATFFNRNGKNIIDWTRTVDTAKWQPNNFHEIITTGLEIETEWTIPSTTAKWTMNYTYLDAGYFRTENVQSRYALANLRHQLNTGLRYQLGDSFSHQTTFRYLDRLHMDDYTLVDSKVAYRFRQFTIHAKVMNIFNMEYTETNLVPMPPRWFLMGATWEIE